NDISSLTDMIVAMRHEKRRFVEQVDFITSPGWIKGRRTRTEAGLPQGGMWRVVTDLAVMGFDEETREMKVLALNEGVTREMVQDNTGFPLLFDGKLETAEPPRKQELDVLRELDPERLYTAYVSLSPQAGREAFERSTHGQEERHRVRHRHAQLHQVSGDAGCAGADRLRRAHGGAGLRVDLGLGSHPVGGRSELPHPRGADDPHGDRRAHLQDQGRHRHPGAADAQPR